MDWSLPQQRETGRKREREREKRTEEMEYLQHLDRLIDFLKEYQLVQHTHRLNHLQDEAELELELD